MTEPQWTPDHTLGEAREWLIENGRRGTGVDCPACGRRVKIYAYSIEKVWVDVLAAVDHDFEEWVYLPKYKTDGQKEAMLRHWGLLEREEGSMREDGNPRTGHYRITDLGHRFLHGVAQVPRRILVFNNQAVFEDENDLIDVHQAYGHPWHYDKFMRGEG